MVASFNPQRLDAARLRRGMTKKALAASIDVSTMTLNRYEREVDAPTAEKLRMISEVLDFPESFFYAPTLDVPFSGAVSFRSVTSLSKRLLNQSLVAGAIGRAFFNWIEERYSLPKPNIPRLAPETDPELAARYARAQWGIGVRSIQDIMNLLENHGVRFLGLMTDTKDVDAFSFWRGGVPYVFLNTFTTAERIRMDIAHELGHLLLHSGEGDQPRISVARDREREREAFAFGSAFLMPEETVLAHAPRIPSIENLTEAKKLWGVSISSLAYRMHKIGCISDYQYRIAFMQIGKLGYRTSEPEPMPQERSRLLENILVLMRRKNRTLSQVADEIFVYPRELYGMLAGVVPHTAGPFLTID